MASTWGGIGEGLTAGINNRIAIEEQRRKDRTAQANLDRQFQFAKEQANRAQANADRAYEASRADRATDVAFRSEQANRAQANADRDYALKSALSEAELQMKGDELQLKGEELRLKEEAQSWQGKLNEEKFRQFKLANETLDMELNKKKEQEQALVDTGRKQLALAFSRLENGGGDVVTLDNGAQARSLGADAVQRIFGKDNKFFAGLQDIVAIDTDKGVQFGMVRPDGTMQMFDDSQRYGVYKSVYGKDFADSMMGDAHDLGMFATKAKITTDEKIREENATAETRGARGYISALQTLIREGALNEKEEAEVKQTMLEIMRRRGSGSRNRRLAELEQKAKAAGLVIDPTTGKFVRPTGGDKFVRPKE